MQDVSAVGIHIFLKASETFPNGFTLSAFPGDGDLGTTGETDIASSESGINGDLIWWKTATGVEVTIPVIPNTPEDVAMSSLFAANKVTKGRRAAKDVITMVATNPITGVPTTYQNGYIRNGNPGLTYGGDGRIRTKNYGFTFESVL